MSTPTVQLDVILTAEISTPASYAFRSPRGNRLTRLAGAMRPGAEALRMPCLAFAVRHPSAGTILIDTGMHADVHGDLRQDFGTAMSIVFRSMEASQEPFDEQLRLLGIDPGAVGRVIMTHLHVDHTSGMRLLPNAEFTCAREEWAAARGRLAVVNGYVGHHLPAEERMRLVDFGRDGEPHATFDRTIDLLGDGTIRLISTPGHSAGHLSVLLLVEGERQVLLVGDAAYAMRNIEEQVLPALTADDEAAARSLAQLKRYAQSEPEAMLVPSHDPVAWHALRDVGRSANRAPA